jgi:hypothetical protein
MNQLLHGYRGGNVINMRRIIAAAITAAGLGAIGVLPSVAASASTQATVFYADGYSGWHATVRPVQMNFGADSGIFLTGLKWSEASNGEWTSSEAISLANAVGQQMQAGLCGRSLQQVPRCG